MNTRPPTARAFLNACRAHRYRPTGYHRLHRARLLRAAVHDSLPVRWPLDLRHAPRT